MLPSCKLIPSVARLRRIPVPAKQGANALVVLARKLVTYLEIVSRGKNG